MEADVGWLVLGTLGALTFGVLFVLVLLAGFCAVFGLPKLRRASRKSRVAGSLDELVGEATTFLPADTPRGTFDQLGAGTSRGAGS